MSESEHLLPCPFCGSEVVIEETPNFLMSGDKDKNHVLIKCTSLDYCLFAISPYLSRSGTVAQWNNRHYAKEHYAPED